MGFFDKWKKEKKQEQPVGTPPKIEGPAEIPSGIRYKDMEIVIDFNGEESRAHIRDDFDVLLGAGIEKTIRERFVPWLKGDQYPDRDDALIFEGLHLTEITYHHGRIIAAYSPTGQDDRFGQFAFMFDSGSAYTEDMLEAVAMEVFVIDGKIVKVSGYDV